MGGTWGEMGGHGGILGAMGLGGTEASWGLWGDGEVRGEHRGTAGMWGLWGDGEGWGVVGSHLGPLLPQRPERHLGIPPVGVGGEEGGNGDLLTPPGGPKGGDPTRGPHTASFDGRPTWGPPEPH